MHGSDALKEQISEIVAKKLCELMKNSEIANLLQSAKHSPDLHANILAGLATCIEKSLSESRSTTDTVTHGLNTMSLFAPGKPVSSPGKALSTSGGSTLAGSDPDLTTHADINKSL